MLEILSDLTAPEHPKAEARFDALFREAPYAMVLVGRDGTIQDVNNKAAELTGFALDALRGMRVDRLVPEGSRVQHAELRAGFGNAKHVARIMGANRDVQLQRQDGTTLPVEITLVPYNEGNDTWTLAALIDLTERKNTQRLLEERTKTLERINHELDQFANVVSHDLKAPLRGIQHLITWIGEDLGDKLDGRAARYFDQLRDRATRLQNLLDSLLTHARVGRAESQISDVDTAEVVQNASDLLLVSDQFVISCGNTMPTIRTDKTAFDQVMRNLIGNALKHHDRDHGRVLVSSKDLGAQIEFRIEDDGPGIPQQYHERVFEMFQTLKPRDEVEGSGMGLAIVKKIVEAIGGTITLQSDPARKRGTAILFTWPKDRPA